MDYFKVGDRVYYPVSFKDETDSNGITTRYPVFDYTKMGVVIKVLKGSPGLYHGDRSHRAYPETYEVEDADTGKNQGFFTGYNLISIEEYENRLAKQKEQLELEKKEWDAKALPRIAEALERIEKLLEKVLKE